MVLEFVSRGAGGHMGTAPAFVVRSGFSVWGGLIPFPARCARAELHSGLLLIWGLGYCGCGVLY